MSEKGKKPIPKTQREISISQQTPYNGINPNSSTEFNRGEKFSFRGDNTKPFSIGIKDIDESILYYFENVIKPSVEQNGERIPVPVIYGSPERWKSYQKDGFYRDLKGSIMAPLIMFKRDEITKKRNVGNKLDANQPNNIGVFKKKFTSRMGYDNFSVLTGQKREETYYAVVIPDYVTVTYTCIIFTNYVEQLNKLIEAVEYASDSYWGDPSRFKFKATINSFSSTIETSNETDRIVKSVFTIKLDGYIIPDTIQKDLNAINKFGNKFRLVFNIETTSGIESFSVTMKPVANTNTAFIDYSTLVIGTGGSGGTISTPMLTYLNENKQITGTVVNGTTITFTGTWLAAPSPLPATSLDNFTFFCNGNLIELTAIVSFIDSGVFSTLVVNTSSLGYLIPSDAEVVAIGKFA